MKSKKIFSVILSLSLMFSGMSVCFGEESARNLNKNAFDGIKQWAIKCNENCTLSVGNDYTKCTFDDEIELIRFKNGNFKVSNSTDIFANYNGDNVWIYNGRPVFYQFKDGLVEPKKALDLLLNWGGLDREIKQQLTLPTEKGIMQNESAVDGITYFHWWYLPIVGCLAWLGNLIYENYKLITGKNNKNAQVQQSKYYYDSNSGIYYVIDQQGTFQPVYKDSALVMMQQEKKEPQNEEKPSNPEDTENKEEAPKTEEKPSRAEQDKILKDIVEDALN